MLAAHPAISTVPEPWILLPLVYATRERGVRAEYWHQAAAQAIKDFGRELPEGDLDAGVRDLALDLYAKAAEPDATYFLDKTPHYHFIAADIIRLFPDGKFVFLWRNPLAILASLLETFRAGRFQPAYFKRDLVDGYRNLVEARQLAGERAHAVRYEELVSDGEPPWRSLFDFLELDFDPAVLSDFADVSLTGRFGDPTGASRYRSLSTEPLEKWTHTLDGEVRRRWCSRYLDQLGERALEAMGYDAADLRRQLGETPASRSSTRDVLDLGLSIAGQAMRDRALSLTEAPRPTGPTYGDPLTVRSGAGRLVGAVRRRSR